jgi:hypothetical protein
MNKVGTKFYLLALVTNDIHFSLFLRISYILIRNKISQEIRKLLVEILLRTSVMHKFYCVEFHKYRSCSTIFVGNSSIGFHENITNRLIADTRLKREGRK